MVNFGVRLIIHPDVVVYIRKMMRFVCGPLALVVRGRSSTPKVACSKPTLALVRQEISKRATPTKIKDPGVRTLVTGNKTALKTTVNAWYGKR